jgi:hypothetical protein
LGIFFCAILDIAREPSDCGRLSVIARLSSRGRLFFIREFKEFREFRD